MSTPFPEFERVYSIVKQLRHPTEGCPWDLKQTHRSLLKYLLEESYEYIDAVEKNDNAEMRDEMGDVLLQVLLHSVIAEQGQRFNFEEVCGNLADKLVRRHPHVFTPDGIPLAQARGGPTLDADGVLKQWQEIKQTEKGQGPDEVPNLIQDKLMHAPALTSAFNIGKKTAEIHFDWEDAAQVAYKVEEEWQELKEEMTPVSGERRQRMEEELGDFLFSAAQLARHLKIDPEEALRQANKKFLGRFQKMEGLIKKSGKDIRKMNQTEMDVFWDQVKKLEKAQK